MAERMEKSEEEWRETLSPEEYRVLRERGTERAFTGAYVDTKEEGLYRCRACQAPLFRSDTKYDSRSGWPAFWAPVSDDAVEEREDTSHGMRRTEVLCARCGSHLGHVFPDGPRPTGMRYCVNSISLELDPNAGEASR